MPLYRNNLSWPEAWKYLTPEGRACSTNWLWFIIYDIMWTTSMLHFSCQKNLCFNFHRPVPAILAFPSIGLWSSLNQQSHLKLTTKKEDKNWNRDEKNPPSQRVIVHRRAVHCSFLVKGNDHAKKIKPVFQLTIQLAAWLNPRNIPVSYIFIKWW